MKNTHSHRATRSPGGSGQVAGMIAVLSGAAVLSGWFFDIHTLKSILPGAVSMKANTALCFVLTGVAMWLLAHSLTGAAAAVQRPDASARSARWKRLAAASCLGFVIVVASLTLLEYITEADFGIDKLLFNDGPSPGTSHAGRMAPNTAAAFILLAGGLWAMARPRAGGLLLAGAGLTTLLALLLGLVSVMGYVGDVPLAFGWGGLTKMALHTSVLFTLLGAASLRLLWRRSGMLWGISGWLVGVFATGLLLLITRSFLSYRQVRVSLEHNGWVQHSDQVLIKIRDVRSFSAELFSAARIYLLTGREDLIDDYSQLADLLIATQDELLALTADNPAQQERVRTLGPLLTEGVQFTEKMISTRRTAGFEAASAIVATGRGVQLLTDIRKSVAEIDREEQQLRDLRERDSQASVARLFLILPLGTFMTLTLFLVVLLYLNAEVVERQRAGEAKDRLAAIIASSDEAITSKNLDGIITSWNNGASRLFGYSAAEAIGQPMLMLFPPERVQEESDILARIGRGECLDPFETEHVRKDGTRIAVSATISPLYDAGGRVIGASKIVRDVTEQKRADEEIRSLNENLEQRVVARTAQLEAANRELEAFSYSVSHDLRAPLRSVDSFARIIVEDYGDKLDAEGNRLLGIVCNEAKRMGQLIDDLLNFSRMGRQHLSTGRVNMAALAQEVFDDLSPEARKHVQHFEVKPMPEITADRSMFRQVFANLIGNAVKFTGQSAGAIIEVGCTTADGMHTFYIKDNGAGFDDRYLHKLFGVFQRLHAEHEFEGTGVGLAIVQRIVHRHGGKIWAEGKINQGATFYFALPTREKS